MNPLLLELISVLLAAVAGTLAWHQPAKAIAWIALLLPTYVLRFTIAGIPLTVLEVMILVVVVVFFIRHRLDWVGSVRRTAWWGVLLLLASVVALMVTPDLRAGLGIWKAYIIEPMLLYIVGRASIGSIKDIERIWWALGLSAVAVAVIALAQYATGWGIPEPWQLFPGRRAVSLYGYPNAVGLYLAPIAALWIGAAIHLPVLWTQHRWTILTMITCLCAGAIVARADGAIVAIAAATIVSMLWTKRRTWAIGISLIVGALSIAIPATRAIILFQDVSGDVRRALWVGTARLLQAHPFVGSGLAGFPHVYDSYRLPSHVELLQYPHNIILTFWTELGLLGAIWICGTLLWWAWTSLQLRRAGSPHGVVLLGVLIAIVVYGLVDVPYFKNDLAVLFWLWLAQLSTLVLLRRQH